MKRKIACLLACVLLCISFCSCGKQTSPVEDFTYEFEEGTVKITGYVGTDREIVIPDTIEERPVTTIGEEAFQGYDLVSVTFPDTLQTIESDAFTECTNLKSVEIPEGVTEIGSHAFEKCKELVDINLPDRLTILSNDIFSDCVSLENIVIPDNVEEIGREAFLGCENLKSVTMSDTLFEKEKEDFIHSNPYHSNNGYPYYDYGIFCNCPNVSINGTPISEFDMGN